MLRSHHAFVGAKGALASCRSSAPACTRAARSAIIAAAPSPASIPAVAAWRAATPARAISTAAWRLQAATPKRSDAVAAAAQSTGASAAAAATPSASASASAASAPAHGSSAFTDLPTEMPAFTPLSQVDLSAVVPPLAKHRTLGWLIYASPMERAVKAVKAFSLTSAAMALISAPVMVVLANPAMPLAGRLAIAGTVVLFGLSTTVALTYFTRSYIIRVFARQLDRPLAAPASATAARKPAKLPVAPLDPSSAASPASAAADDDADAESPADKEAALRWVLTVETFNVFGRSVFTTAPHAAFHPLFSRLFNNVRVEWKGTDEEAGVKPVCKDLFLHMDQATNPLMVPLWSKPTVVSGGKSVNVSADGAEAQLGVGDRVTLSLAKATKLVEEHNKRLTKEKEERERKEEEQQQQQGKQ